MAGNELVTEGFQPGQVGSSAMPHKMNTRSCERVNGFAVLLRGYACMAGELAVTSGTKAMSHVRSFAGWRCLTRSSRSTGCSRRS